MKIVETVLDLSFEAGMIKLSERKNMMDIYNAHQYSCVCGLRHQFNNKLVVANYGSSGANVKMIVMCPQELGGTLIESKMKWLVKFDTFISLAGWNA
ncbi:hypothetical protein [Moritella marina]|uniref:hypothetical protein n=1 Tax=Moritella marina TaxID=90736 RepID=UPI00370396DA